MYGSSQPPTQQDTTVAYYAQGAQPTQQQQNPYATSYPSQSVTSQPSQQTTPQQTYSNSMSPHAAGTSVYTSQPSAPVPSPPPSQSAATGLTYQVQYATNTAAAPPSTGFVPHSGGGVPTQQQYTGIQQQQQQTNMAGGYTGFPKQGPTYTQRAYQVYPQH